MSTRATGGPILFAITHLCVGGAQAFLLRLASEAAKHSPVIMVDLGIRDGGEDLSRLKPELRILRYPMLLQRLDRRTRGRWPGGRRHHLAFRALWLRAVVGLYRPRLVHSHLYHADHSVYLSNVWRRIPWVLSDHGDYRYVVNQGVVDDRTVRSIFLATRRIVCPCEANRRVLEREGAPAEKIRKVFYGQEPLSVEPSPIGVTPKGSLMFGMVARGIPEKGWAAALEAFQLVRARTSRPVQLTFVGDGPYIRELKATLPTDLAHAVHFVGHSNDVARQIQSFDVALLPTYFDGESLPMSIVEYLQMHKPVIATDIGGIPEMLAWSGGALGQLIPLTNERKPSIPHLVEAMLAYCEDSDLLRRHTEASSVAAGRFSIAECTKRYVSLYEEVSA